MGVQLLHARIVVRHGRHASKNLLYKRLLRKRKERVGGALIAQRRLLPLAHTRPAKRSSPMAWIDLYAVGQDRHALVKATIKLMRKTFLRLIAQKIRTAKRPYKEKVAGEQRNRLGGTAVRIEQHKGEMFG